MVKKISCEKITEAVAEMTLKSNLYLPPDVKQKLNQALDNETNPLAHSILTDLIKNQDIAQKSGLPLCQDTGLAVVFVELGQEVLIEGGLLYDAINAGISRGYTEHYLRKSIVSHPWLRKNSGDNTPAVIHTFLTGGDQLKITLMPKGGGAENYAALTMLTPAQGLEGVKEFVIESVKKAGPNACPPIVVGVGVGGNFELAPLLAKKALGRPLGQVSLHPEVAELEHELLAKINSLGIGPQGLGGDTTALGVAVEIYPCHIASLPVAVNLNCHVSRHESVIL